MPSTTSWAALLKLSRSLISLPSGVNSTASKTVVRLLFPDDVPVAPFDAETLAPPEVPPLLAVSSLVFALPTTATLLSLLKSGNPIPHPVLKKPPLKEDESKTKGCSLACSLLDLSVAIALPLKRFP